MESTAARRCADRQRASAQRPRGLAASRPRGLAGSSLVQFLLSDGKKIAGQLLEAIRGLRAFDRLRAGSDSALGVIGEADPPLPTAVRVGARLPYWDGAAAGANGIDDDPIP